ncbi:G1/S-specific cyclin-E1 [Orchesella cincta]|uniref:G1/S-specific cyclin-E1 n=1 Tax=Orchesella cincta TaxID=48709 RepID=A0A1D2MQL3_ORCCI|nr:G1/S-specific cyclin-E1 [Orchesella cincta]
MLTRSHCSYTSEMRKSLPGVLNKNQSRKRKSTVLQDGDGMSEEGYVRDLRYEASDGTSDTFPRRTLRRRSCTSRTSSRSSYSDFRKPDDVDSSSCVSSTCSTSTVSTTRRSRYSKKAGSDAESLLSTLSIDDSLSGRSTPPRSKVSRCSNGAPAKALVDPSRPSPLPPVTFGDHKQIWEMMCLTDCKYMKDANLFKNHPVLTSQMRSILLDWIMDVCEAYHLHRETLYLAVDYLDRYLATQNNVLKNHLQLIGITCLFIAAKMEEIYPPKLKTFAYVTDGACSENEILDMELVVTKALKWKLTPMTPCNWVNVYLQIISILAKKSYHTRSTSDAIRSFRDNKDAKGEDKNLTKVRYDGVDFVRAIRIIDLTILDVYSLQFTSSLLAASAVYHTKGRTAAMSASGFSWEQIAPCAHWMAPYATAVRKEDVPDVLPSIENVPDEMRHLIHSHCVSLELLEKAHLLASTNKVCSPLAHSGEIVTPPRSGEKHRRRNR